MTIGKRIQEAREMRGITRLKLASIIGVSESALWRWETEERRISAETLYDLAVALNLPLSYFFGGSIVGANGEFFEIDDVQIAQLPIVSDLIPYLKRGEVLKVMAIPITLFGDVTPRSFIFIVDISSMPSVIPDHSQVIVNPDTELETGSVALSIVHGKATLRAVTKRTEGLFLGDEPVSEDVYPVGKIVKILSDPILRV